MSPVAVCRSCGHHAVPVEVPERLDAVVLLRIWRNDAVLQGRLLAAGGSQHSIAVADGVDDICAAVRSWLKTL